MVTTKYFKGCRSKYPFLQIIRLTQECRFLQDYLMMIMMGTMGSFSCYNCITCLFYLFALFLSLIFQILISNSFNIWMLLPGLSILIKYGLCVVCLLVCDILYPLHFLFLIVKEEDKYILFICDRDLTTPFISIYIFLVYYLPRDMLSSSKMGKLRFCVMCKSNCSKGFDDDYWKRKSKITSIISQ